jgi:hypothetical protein
MKQCACMQEQQALRRTQQQAAQEQQQQEARQARQAAAAQYEDAEWIRKSERQQLEALHAEQQSATATSAQVHAPCGNPSPACCPTAYASWQARTVCVKRLHEVSSIRTVRVARCRRTCASSAQACFTVAAGARVHRL